MKANCVCRFTKECGGREKMSGGEEGVRRRRDVGRKRHSQSGRGVCAPRGSGQEAQHGRGRSVAGRLHSLTSLHEQTMCG